MYIIHIGEYGVKKSIKLLDCEPCMKGLPREVPNLFLAEEKKLRKKLKKTNSKKILDCELCKKGLPREADYPLFFSYYTFFQAACCSPFADTAD
jgi:hypothetical protein